ncbi:MAG TPA: hypothetical protein VNJ70_17900 [Thermoanaerobaculia bacterium]|nr:hypothetical protein [Thermoanaerobaculia bacterium]
MTELLVAVLTVLMWVLGAFLLGTVVFTLYLYRHSTRARHVPPVALGFSITVGIDLLRASLAQIPTWAMATRCLGWALVLVGLRRLLIAAAPRKNDHDA